MITWVLTLQSPGKGWIFSGGTVQTSQGLLFSGNGGVVSSSLREELLLVKQHVGCRVEVDAVNVSVAVNGWKPTNGVAGFVIDDVKALFANVQVFKCQTIPKVGNSLTHNLASVAISGYLF
ncbi:hypothetical protein Q3G72_014993 [Acer saccharum]|nr:hypothetical protein Q3G72_014993 [Acer saccharum]